MAAKPTSPPPPASTASAPAAAAPAATKTGFDILRPFRYAKGFVGGTINSSLNGMANWGRAGMWFGGGLGVLVMLAGATTLGPAAVILGLVGGLATGAVAGGVVGAATGGLRGVNREVRRDKYSEDLLAKAKARSRPTPTADYREAHREHKRNEGYFIDRVFQQERENERDTSTYFQDMVNHSRSGGHERGF